MKHWNICESSVAHGHLLFAPFSITHLSYQFVVLTLRLYHPDAKDLTYCYMPIIIIKFQYFMFLFPLLLLYNILIIFIMCTLYSLWLHFLFFKLYFMTLTLVKTSLEWWVSSSPTFCVSIENTLVIRTRNFLFLLKDMNYKHCLVPKWPA